MGYRDISGRQEDEFLNTYVESIFRAFDANKDDLLTFREWQVGFYLLLLLPSDKNTDVSKEDFLLALEIIFRLYDQHGEQEGDRADLDHHHPAGVRRQVQQRCALHRQ